MKRRQTNMARLRDAEVLAAEKARRWAQLALIARQAGREANANRCEDKARDWHSRARQVERRTTSTFAGTCAAMRTQKPTVSSRTRNTRRRLELVQRNHQEMEMKTMNLVTLVLVIVGGLNWGLVGLANFDLVAALFGPGSGLSRLVYVVVGLSALYQIVPLTKAFRSDEPRAEAARQAR